MTINIKYRPLKAFLLAADSGSFTFAADRLGVTPPSFSALIRDLEDALGVRLFDRTTRTVALTAAGSELLARIQRPVTDLEDAYRSILALAVVGRGSVVLGALPSTSLTLIPPALRELRLAHPTLRVRVVEAHNEQLISMVRTNQIEFALATVLAPAADLAFHPLIADRWFAVFPAGHELAARTELHWRDLVPYDIILLSQGSSARAQFELAVGAEAAAPATSSRYDVTHMTTSAGLVRQGLGITMLPRLALPELNLKGLKSRPLNDASARRTIGLLHRRDRSLSPATRALAAQLTKVAVQVEKTLPPMRTTQREARKPRKQAR